MTSFTEYETYPRAIFNKSGWTVLQSNFQFLRSFMLYGLWLENMFLKKREALKTAEVR